MFSLSCWPIRRKLVVGGGLLCLVVAILAISGFQGVYSYRNLVRGLRDRAAELPLAAELGRNVSELRITASRIQQLRALPTGMTDDQRDVPVRRIEFHSQLMSTKATVNRYREQLTAEKDGDSSIDDTHLEQNTLSRIEQSLNYISAHEADAEWAVQSQAVSDLNNELDSLDQLANELPSHLHGRLRNLASEVRTEYRALIFLTWITSVFTIVMLVGLGWFFAVAIFQPLRGLVHDARIIEAGNFSHRVLVRTKDEIAEVGAAMNAMTDRLEGVNKNQARVLAERTEELEQRNQELVRSEQMASVGFLAAGVAHEINNPLQGIIGFAGAVMRRLSALSSPPQLEELERLDTPFLRDAIGRIQQEANRCKGITGKLLDFSRLGETEKQDANLRGLTLDMIEMARAAGKCKGKQIVFHGQEDVVAAVNSQEIKQVILNLLTNALESLDVGGTVQVDLRRVDGDAELVVTDDGCGMTEEVLRDLFQPFFTRRRQEAGPGTGLGLTISHRIIEEHHGSIQAFSEGPGKGSRMRITLPLKSHETNQQKRQSQAA